MARVSLPFRGVAVVLLCTSAAAGQTPLHTADYSDEFPSPFTLEAIWQKSFGQPLPSMDDFTAPQFGSIRPVMWRDENEMPSSLETNATTDLPTFGNTALFDSPSAKDSKDTKDTKEVPRLAPMPSPGAPASPAPSVSGPASPAPSVGGPASPPASLGTPTSPPSFGGPASPPESCPFDGEPCGPFDDEEAFPCEATMLPFACPCPHRCKKFCRKHRGCRGGDCDNPYFDCPCGFQGCGDFCALPVCSSHKCHRKRRCYNDGCAAPWSVCGDMGCDGFMGPSCPAFFCPPPLTDCSCRKCQRKHFGHHKDCGYAGCGYGCGFGYPGFSDCFGGFMDPYCYGGCGKRHGLLHRCHACRRAQPYPCFGFPMQPCMDMDMDMGCCSDF